LASWYGAHHQGKKTASGERFDKNALTAAHRTLRFGTRVRVTHRDNGRSVVVRINDRGPFGGRGRVIDLSEAAARRLGIIASGVASVRLDIVSGPAAPR
jgi:rare lipoprotein A